jgi:hypothetical protein
LEARTAFRAPEAVAEPGAPQAAGEPGAPQAAGEPDAQLEAVAALDAQREAVAPDAAVAAVSDARRAAVGPVAVASDAQQEAVGPAAVARPLVASVELAETAGCPLLDSGNDGFGGCPAAGACVGCEGAGSG